MNPDESEKSWSFIWIVLARDTFYQCAEKTGKKWHFLGQEGGAR